MIEFENFVVIDEIRLFQRLYSGDGTSVTNITYTNTFGLYFSLDECPPPLIGEDLVVGNIRGDYQGSDAYSPIYGGTTSSGSGFSYFNMDLDFPNYFMLRNQKALGYEPYKYRNMMIDYTKGT